MTGVPIEAVLFDWGGTLTPWHNLDPHLGWAALTDDAERAAALRSAEAAVWLRSRDHHRSGTLAEILSAAEHQPDEDALARYHAWWDEHTITDPAAAGMLRDLRAAGLKTGVLSNTLWSRQRHEQIFTRDGILDLLDGAIYSSEIEWSKPHPLAFRAALDAVGVQDPARAVFVGDRPFDDIWGASSVGMRTILLPHSDIPAEQIGHTVADADAVVSSLSEIPAVVARWRAGQPSAANDGAAPPEGS